MAVAPGATVEGQEDAAIRIQKVQRGSIARRAAAQVQADKKSLARQRHQMKEAELHGQLSKVQHTDLKQEENHEQDEAQEEFSSDPYQGPWLHLVRALVKQSRLYNALNMFATPGRKELDPDGAVPVALELSAVHEGPLGISLRGDGKVMDVAPNSWAALSGVQVSDDIISINGRSPWQRDGASDQEVQLGIADKRGVELDEIINLHGPARLTVRVLERPSTLKKAIRAAYVPMGVGSTGSAASRAWEADEQRNELRQALDAEEQRKAFREALNEEIHQEMQPWLTEEARAEIMRTEQDESALLETIAQERRQKGVLERLQPEQTKAERKKKKEAKTEAALLQKGQQAKANIDERNKLEEQRAIELQRANEEAELAKQIAQLEEAAKAQQDDLEKAKAVAQAYQDATLEQAPTSPTAHNMETKDHELPSSSSNPMFRRRSTAVNNPAPAESHEKRVVGANPFLKRASSRVESREKHTKARDHSKKDKKIREPSASKRRNESPKKDSAPKQSAPKVKHAGLIKPVVHSPRDGLSPRSPGLGMSDFWGTSTSIEAITPGIDANRELGVDEAITSAKPVNESTKSPENNVTNGSLARGVPPTIDIPEEDQAGLEATAEDLGNGDDDDFWGALGRQDTEPDEINTNEAAIHARLEQENSAWTLFGGDEVHKDPPTSNFVEGSGVVGSHSNIKEELANESDSWGIFAWQDDANDKPTSKQAVLDEQVFHEQSSLSLVREGHNHGEEVKSTPMENNDLSVNQPSIAENLADDSWSPFGWEGVQPDESHANQMACGEDIQQKETRRSFGADHGQVELKSPSRAEGSVAAQISKHSANEEVQSSAAIHIIEPNAAIIGIGSSNVKAEQDPAKPGPTWASSKSSGITIGSASARVAQKPASDMLSSVGNVQLASSPRAKQQFLVPSDSKLVGSSSPRPNPLLTRNLTPPRVGVARQPTTPEMFPRGGSPSPAARDMLTTASDALSPKKNLAASPRLIPQHSANRSSSPKHKEAKKKKDKKDKKDKAKESAEDDTLGLGEWFG